MTFSEISEALKGIENNEVISIGYCNNVRIIGILEEYNPTLIKLRYGKRMTCCPIQGVEFIEYFDKNTSKELYKMIDVYDTMLEYKYAIYCTDKLSKKYVEEMKETNGFNKVGFSQCGNITN